MNFFADTSFFVFLTIIMCIAAWLGIHEKPLKRFGLGASVFMLFWLFFRTPIEGIYAAAYVVLSALMTQWVWQKPKSKIRLQIALVCALVPLVVSKITQTYATNILGFMGISYVTFRVVQVLIETKDGLTTAMDLADYVYFLIFFPTFTSGPIDRSRRFQEDLDRTLPKDEYEGLLAKGILLIMIGMVYNIVFATIARTYWVPETWAQYGEDFWLALWRQIRNAYAYGLYLFFDFAGYSMMAMGTGYALGIKVPRNFKAPFVATSITDFWNRWHITLSTWLRDFVFMRLARWMIEHKTFSGKNRRLHTAQAALIIDMVVMGFWHGPTVEYVCYGLYHGILLALEQSWEKTKFYKKHRHRTIYRIISWFIVMQLVFFGFAIFNGQIPLLLGGA